MYQLSQVLDTMISSEALIAEIQHVHTVSQKNLIVLQDLETTNSQKLFNINQEVSLQKM